MFKKDNDPWVRTFTVSDPTRHSKGYTIYRVISKVFPKNSIEAVTQVTVWKRYSDFKNLHKALSALHQGLYLKGTFPIFAKAQIFGRFDNDVIEKRRQCALELLEFAAKYPPLFTSQVFVKFFEGGHVVDSPTDPEEKCIAEVLQPTSLSNNAQTTETESNPKTNEPVVSCEENNETLGGIWKHRQAADDISIDSHISEGEEDDNATTFTDDDPSKSTVSDLSEFDPLSELNSSKLSSQSKPEDLCHEWLLSAFESFGNTVTEKNDSDSNLIFPKPFSDTIDLDLASNSNNISSNIKTEDPELVNSQNSRELSQQTVASSGIENSSELCNDLAISSQEDTEAYVSTARHSIAMAEQSESNKYFHKAFTYYKDAAEILLLGAKSEKSFENRKSIQKVIINCIRNAERIYDSYLVDCDKHNQSGLSGPERVIAKQEDHVGIRRTIKDLSKYRVIGILSKILLVLDVVTNITCVVKVLRKSPEPQQSDVPNIAPRSLDFMVQLYEMYETNDAIFLILEYASGGRLWDYISSYLQRSPLSPANDSNFHVAVQGIKSDLNNVYSGKKLNMVKTLKDIDISPVANNLSLSTEPSGAEVFPPSYAALFRNYAAGVSDNNVSLAKCRTKNISPINFSDSNEILNNETLIAKNNLSVNNDVKDPAKNISLQKNGIICNVESQLLFNEKQSPYCSPEILECNNLNHDAHSEVSHWLNSCNQENNKDTASSNSDLCTFLTGAAGKTFINQDFVEENESLTIETENNLLLQKKVGFTEVFHKMDVEVSLANSKPTYLPESCIAFWAAEIIIALESLHKLGIIWKDLRPENILLGSEGHILLSYQSQWNSVDRMISQKAIQNLYAAPEVCGIFPVKLVCDWWSLGAILFELITGRRLVSCYPSGVTSHTNIKVPDGVSTVAEDLLQKLLKYIPSERLGSGEDGVGDIKCHPFFNSIIWDSLKSF